MNELKVTPAILFLTLTAICYSFFSQPNLKPIFWKRGEKQIVFGVIERAIAKSPGELSLDVRVDRTRIFLALPQPFSSNKCGVGNTIKAEVKIYPIQPGFNGFRELYDNLLYHQGVIARTWLGGNYQCFGPNIHPPLRLKFFNYLSTRFGDSDQLSLIMAINFGAGELIGENLKGLFRNLGLSHALVVSGFHVGLVYTIIFLFLDYLFSRSLYLLNVVPSEFIAKPIALIISIIFAIITGLAMPCLRAILFLIVSAFYKLLGCSASGMHRVLMTFSVLLLLNPSSLFDLSLLLSVAAVFGVLAGLRVQSILSSATIRYKKLLSVFAINFFAWFFTLPICLIFFGQLFICSPVINFLLLPFITVFFSLFGVVGAFLSSLDNYCLNYLFRLILLVLGHFLDMFWQIPEILPFEVQQLEFIQAVIIAGFSLVIDIFIIIFLSRYSTKQIDYFQQLAPA